MFNTFKKFPVHCELKWIIMKNGKKPFGQKKSFEKNSSKRSSTTKRHKINNAIALNKKQQLESRPTNQN